MKLKRLITSLMLVSLLFLTVGGLGACSNKGNKPEYTGFLPGATAKIPVGEMILVEDFIDYPEEGESKIEISKGDFSKNLTNRATWTPDEPGDYVMTHTVTGGKYEGEYKLGIEIIASAMTWAHSSAEMNLLYDTDFEFNDMYDTLNIAVDAAFEWEFFVQSVRVGNTITEFDKDATSYHIKDLDTHYFIYGVRAENGEQLRAIATAHIAYSKDVVDLYLGVNTSGEHTIEINDATNVKVNGKDCTDATINQSGVVFEKSVLREKYPGINFVAVQTAEGEKRFTLNVFTENYSFEGANSMVPSFLTVHSGNLNVNTGSLRITEDFVTDGEKALETKAPDYMWPSYMISMKYLDMVFEDANAVGLAIDITYAGATEANSWRDATWLNAEGKIVGGIYLNRNVASTLQITRGMYEMAKSMDKPGFFVSLQNSRNAQGGYDKYAKLVFDNIRAVYETDADSVFAGENSNGNYTLEMQGVTDVKIKASNKTAFYKDVLDAPSASEITYTEENVQISKEWLKNYVGENKLIIKANGKTYQMTFNVYPDEYTFDTAESRTVPSFIIWTGPEGVTCNRHFLEVAGSYAYRMHTGPTSTPSFAISTAWLEDVFADATVKKVSWDFTLQGAGEGAEYRKINMHAGVIISYKCNVDETKVMTITRADYNAWKASSNFNTVGISFKMNNLLPNEGGGTKYVSAGLVFDNIELVRESNSKVDDAIDYGDYWQGN